MVKDDAHRVAWLQRAVPVDVGSGPRKSRPMQKNGRRRPVQRRFRVFRSWHQVVTQHFTDWPEEPVQADTQTQGWSKGCVDIRCHLSVNRAGTMGLGSRGVDGPQTHRNTVVPVGARLLVLV